MIIGAHSIIYRVGDGWLIFGLPPAEVAVHPSNENDVHEFYLMCDDVEAFIAEMKKHNVACGPAQDRGWGVLTQLTLPGGGKLSVYQPRHARPKALGEGASARKPVRQTRRAAAKNVRRKAPKKKARKR